MNVVYMYVYHFELKAIFFHKKFRVAFEGAVFTKREYFSDFHPQMLSFKMFFFTREPAAMPTATPHSGQPTWSQFRLLPTFDSEKYFPLSDGRAE